MPDGREPPNGGQDAGDRRADDKAEAAVERASPEAVADAALDRFGTNRLGSDRLETDRLLAVGLRSREGRVHASLRADAGRLLANWVVRIANLPVYRARPDLRLEQVMEGLPTLLHAALQAVSTADPALDPEPAARAAEVATEHGRRRAAGGFPIGAVLAELRELHGALLAEVWRIADEPAQPAPSAQSVAPPTAPPGLPGDAGGMPRSVVERLAATMDSLFEAAAEGWVAGSAAPTAPEETGS
jgi:hypothetical protein